MLLDKKTAPKCGNAIEVSSVWLRYMETRPFPPRHERESTFAFCVSFRKPPSPTHSRSNPTLNLVFHTLDVAPVQRKIQRNVTGMGETAANALVWMESFRHAAMPGSPVEILLVSTASKVWFAVINVFVAIVVSEHRNRMPHTI